MTNKRISILGCGFIGFPLAKALQESGWTVLGSTTTVEKGRVLQEAGIQPFILTIPTEYTSIDNPDFFQSDVLFLNMPFKRTLHDPWLYADQIRSVVDAALKGMVSRIVFTSSTSVYPGDLKEAREDVEFEPSTERAKVLLHMEQELLVQPACETTILRLAGLYGKTREIGRFLAGKVVSKHGAAPVNLVHVDDVAALSRCVIEQGAPQEIFNICSDQHPSRERLYTQKARHLNLPEPQFQNEGQPDVKCVSNQKVTSYFQYQFKYPDPLEHV